MNFKNNRSNEPTAISEENLKRMVHRIFKRYQNEFGLTHSEATGKTIFEITNVIDSSLVLEEVAYRELMELNDGHPEIIRYLSDYINPSCRSNFV